MKKALLEIKEIVLDKGLYPRDQTSWYNTYAYAKAMQAGNVFPNIIVTKFEGKTYVVDGWHRIGALKVNKEKYASVEFIRVKNKLEIYLEGIRRNAQHGRQFTVQEKAKIILKLQDAKISDTGIAKIIGVPTGDMEKFTLDRMTHSISGEPIVLKSSIKHLAGGEITQEIIDAQQSIGGRDQVKTLDGIVKMVKHKLFDLDNPKVVSRLYELRTEFRKMKLPIQVR